LLLRVAEEEFRSLEQIK